MHTSPALPPLGACSQASLMPPPMHHGIPGVAKPRYGPCGVGGVVLRVRGGQTWACRAWLSPLQGSGCMAVNLNGGLKSLCVESGYAPLKRVARPDQRDPRIFIFRMRGGGARSVGVISTLFGARRDVAFVHGFATTSRPHNGS
jgi:hypothetical protein